MSLPLTTADTTDTLPAQIQTPTKRIYTATITTTPTAIVPAVTATATAATEQSDSVISLTQKQVALISGVAAAVIVLVVSIWLLCRHRRKRAKERKQRIQREVETGLDVEMVVAAGKTLSERSSRGSGYTSEGIVYTAGSHNSYSPASSPAETEYKARREFEDVNLRSPIGGMTAGIGVGTKPWVEQDSTRPKSARLSKGSKGLVFQPYF